jgi:SAM-dependent methyltransferase
VRLIFCLLVGIMSLTLEDLDFLIADAGVHLLERLRHEDLSESNTLRLLTALRRDYPARAASAALELARLRGAAHGKFGDDAARMFFTHDALQQASDPHIRRERARRANIEGARVVDAGCSIGSDALAFAAARGDVIGLDMDALRVALARLNAGALGISAAFEVADVRAGIPASDYTFFDPARRTEQGNRIYNVEQYAPPLSTVRGWAWRRLAVKLSPGVDLEQLREYAGSVEFISVDGDLKEALLHCGDETRGARALLLSDGICETWLPQADTPPVPLDAPRAWLCEPDAAIIRAGLVQQAAARYGGALLDETIAYFTSDAPPNAYAVRAWQVLEWQPFNVKRLRDVLRARGIGTVTVKKRGTAVTPEALIPQLKLKGSGACTLVLTRLRGQQIVMVCADLRMPA